MLNQEQRAILEHVKGGVRTPVPNSHAQSDDYAELARLGYLKLNLDRSTPAVRVYNINREAIAVALAA